MCTASTAAQNTYTFIEHQVFLFGENQSAHTFSAQQKNSDQTNQIDVLDASLPGMDSLKRVKRSK